jgi:hypothetical protein
MEALPKSPAMKPVDVKIPVPIMFETTRAVALQSPKRRRNPDDLLAVGADIDRRGHTTCARCQDEKLTRERFCRAL